MTITALSSRVRLGGLARGVKALSSHRPFKPGELPHRDSLMPLTPEQRARASIDAALDITGWIVQDPTAVSLNAGRGVAVREFPLKGGPADYLLFLDGKAAGVIEAKPEGTTLTGVEVQTERYSQALPG